MCIRREIVQVYPYSDTLLPTTSIPPKAFTGPHEERDGRKIGTCWISRRTLERGRRPKNPACPYLLGGGFGDQRLELRHARAAIRARAQRLADGFGGDERLRADRAQQRGTSDRE